MELFTHDKGWDQARADVRFTITAGKASKRHAATVEALVPIIARWQALEAERSAAEEALEDAQAVVAWTSESLDEAIDALCLALLVACGNDRTHGTFTTFFPERPSELTRLALEPKVARVRRWRAVRPEVKLTAAASEALDAVEAIAGAGDVALVSRKDAVDAKASVSVRMKLWRDEANAARRAVEVALDQHAVAHGLAKDYSAKFFPKTPTKKKAKVDAKKAAPARPSAAPPTH
jgi:hypothetical protein